MKSLARTIPVHFLPAQAPAKSEVAISTYQNAGSFNSL